MNKFDIPALEIGFPQGAHNYKEQLLKVIGHAEKVLGSRTMYAKFSTPKEAEAKLEILKCITGDGMKLNATQVPCNGHEKGSEQSATKPNAVVPAVSCQRFACLIAAETDAASIKNFLNAKEVVETRAVILTFNSEEEVKAASRTMMNHYGTAIELLPLPEAWPLVQLAQLPVPSSSKAAAPSINSAVEGKRKREQNESSDVHSKKLKCEPKVVRCEPKVVKCDLKVVTRELKEPPKVVKREPKVVKPEPKEPVVNREPKEPVVNRETKVVKCEPKEAKVVKREPKEPKVVKCEPKEAMVEVDKEAQIGSEKEASSTKVRMKVYFPRDAQCYKKPLLTVLKHADCMSSSRRNLVAKFSSLEEAESKLELLRGITAGGSFLSATPLIKTVWGSTGVPTQEVAGTFPRETSRFNSGGTTQKVPGTPPIKPSRFSSSGNTQEVAGTPSIKTSSGSTSVPTQEVGGTYPRKNNRSSTVSTEEVAGKISRKTSSRIFSVPTQDLACKTFRNSSSASIPTLEMASKTSRKTSGSSSDPTQEVAGITFGRTSIGSNSIPTQEVAGTPSRRKTSRGRTGVPTLEVASKSLRKTVRSSTGGPTQEVTGKTSRSSISSGSSSGPTQEVASKPSRKTSSGLFTSVPTLEAAGTPSRKTVKGITSGLRNDGASKNSRTGSDSTCTSGPTQRASSRKLEKRKAGPETKKAEPDACKRLAHVGTFQSNPEMVRMFFNAKCVDFQSREQGNVVLILTFNTEEEAEFASMNVMNLRGKVVCLNPLPEQPGPPLSGVKIKREWISDTSSDSSDDEDSSDND